MKLLHFNLSVYVLLHAAFHTKISSAIIEIIATNITIAAVKAGFFAYPLLKYSDASIILQAILQKKEENGIIHTTEKTIGITACII